MPAINAPPPVAPTAEGTASFQPISRSHILNCSYDAWFPRYRTSCIRSRIIPLSPEFVEYLREDGIVLANDSKTSQSTDHATSQTTAETEDNDDDDDDWEPQSTTYARRAVDDTEASDSDSDSDSDSPIPPRLPPDRRFPTLHQEIKDKIEELGGAVAPKLNWSSPQDAAWILPNSNTVKCTCPNDVYLLLKSSNFISHDLEHAFDGTVDGPDTVVAGVSQGDLGFQPVLVLRAFFNPNTALEFRCFVKQRNLIGVSQRDLNFYEYLPALEPLISKRIKELFDSKLRLTFPDGNFTFDVYLPESSVGDDKLGKARLIDINPWAPRTDSLLFGWSELLSWDVKRPLLGQVTLDTRTDGSFDDATSTEEDDEDEDEDDEPEVRLIDKENAAAFNFSGSRYSAHKLPRDVVDASSAGPEGLREFAAQWNEVMNSGR